MPSSYTSGEFLGHPKGLFVLFFTEMWERFSYYGMRSLLVYYMMKHLSFNQEQASHVYGLYTGFVYFTPLFGGALADRILGQYRTVLVGAVLMSAGHFMMAWESLFFPALFTLILGNGAFKPNISTQVGNLYAPGDHRRDSAFSIFYVGINLGAFFSPLVCGALGELYGWHYGFSAAGVGMLVGLLIYYCGRGLLPRDSFNPKGAAAHHITDEERASERKSILTLAAVGLITVAFWAVYEQQGNTLALWVDAYTDRRILGWVFPASWFQSLNPALIFILTPLLTRFWRSEAEQAKEPASVTKMAIGCLLLGAGFLIMVFPAAFIIPTGDRAGISWLIAFTTIITLGELYLSPVGLSFVTKTAPPRLVSMMMGMWLSAAFFGNYLAGYLGSFWEKIPKDVFFLTMVGIAFIASACLFLIGKILKAKGSTFGEH